MRRRVIQSILQDFLLCLRRNEFQQAFKTSNGENIFSSVYVIDTTCFGKSLLFQDIFFYKRFLIPWGLFNRHVLALFETSDLKEVLVSFFYLHNTSTVLINTKIKSSKIKFLYIVIVKFFVLLLIFDAPLFLV